MLYGIQGYFHTVLFFAISNYFPPSWIRIILLCFCWNIKKIHQAYVKICSLTTGTKGENTGQIFACIQCIENKQWNLKPALYPRCFYYVILQSSVIIYWLKELYCGIILICGIIKIVGWWVTYLLYYNVRQFINVLYVCADVNS